MLWQYSFKIQLSFIYFLKTEASFIKDILQNYYKKVFLDFSFNCHGNKKLNQDNRFN